MSTRSRLSKQKGRSQGKSLRPSPPVWKKSRVIPGLPESSRLSEILRFRQTTDSLSQDLPANADHLRAWVVECLRLGKLKLLNSSDSSEVARILHNLDRKYRSSKDQKFKRLIHELLEDIRRAYASGTIPQAPQVPLHLLSYYKESGHLDQGVEFWHWLSKENDASLSPVFVGAAIELLALYGAGIRHCEEIYERTLYQQEDISGQYQLQPGAVLPDTSKAITIKGTSLGLLQGILSARLYYGKWRSSYLTLDTAFRLRPSQIVSRILDLFVYERPIFEALPVFFMFCRGGNKVSKVTLTAVLECLKRLSDQASKYTFKIDAIRAMFQVTEAYAGSAGILNTRHLNILSRAIVSTMPPLPSTTSTEPPVDDKDVMRSVIDLFKQLFGYFAEHKAEPDSATFNGIIPVTVSLGYPTLARVLLEDVGILGLSLNEQTARSLLEVAGMSQDTSLLKIAWTYACSVSGSDSIRSPSLRSWRAMVMAAKQCGLESFAEDQLDLQGPESSLRAKLAAEASDNRSVEPPTPVAVESGGSSRSQADEFGDLCAEMLTTVDRMKRSQPGSFRNFCKHPFDDRYFLTWPDLAEESWQRKLYEELTLVKGYENIHPAESTLDETMAVSNTDIPFSELRYSNWKAINSLLIQAGRFQTRLEASTDLAIRERRASSWEKGPKTTGNAAGARHPMTLEQIEAYQQDVDNERSKVMTEEEWRNMILRLRKPEVEV